MKKISNVKKTTAENEKELTLKEIRSYLNNYETVRDSNNITNSQKDILALMLFRGNVQNGFTMGYKHITDMFGYVKSTISAAIGRLQELNFISVEKGHTGVNSKYTLNYEVIKGFKSNATLFDSEIEPYKTRQNKQNRTIQAKSNHTSKRTNEVTDNQAFTRVLFDKLDTIIELLNRTLNININKNVHSIIPEGYNTEGRYTEDKNKKRNKDNSTTGTLKEKLESSEETDKENESNSSIESEMKDNVQSSEEAVKVNEVPFSSEDEIKNNNSVESSEETDKRNEDDNVSRMEEMYFGQGATSNEGNDTSKDNDSSSEETVKGKIEQRNNNNSKTSDMKKAKTDEAIDLKRNDNVPFSSKDEKKDNDSSSEETVKDNEDFFKFGMIQTVSGFATGKKEGYVFHSYKGITEVKDFNKNFRYTSTTVELNLDDIKASVSETGTWGMLKYADGQYSFIQSNKDLSEGILQSNDNTEKKAATATEGEETSNNAHTSDENPNVDNYTTEGEKVAPAQCQEANSASEENADTQTSDNDDENTSNEGDVKTDNDTKDDDTPTDDDTQKGVNADDENSEVDNTTDKDKDDDTAAQPAKSYGEWGNEKIYFRKKYNSLDDALSYYETTKDDEAYKSIVNSITVLKQTHFITSKVFNDVMNVLNNLQMSQTSNNALQAPQSLPMYNYTTSTEKVAPAQCQTVNSASDVDAGIFADDEAQKAMREKVNAQKAANQMKTLQSVNAAKYANGYTRPNSSDTNNPKNWELISSRFTMKNDGNKYTMREAMEFYKALDVKDIHSIMTYAQDMCRIVKKAVETGHIGDIQYNDFKKVFNILSKGYKAYWLKVFTNGEHDENAFGEQAMWKWLGKPKVQHTLQQGQSYNSDNNTYELPTSQTFEPMSLDEIRDYMLRFVNEHPNINDRDKAYINNLCASYALEPLYFKKAV